MRRAERQDIPAIADFLVERFWNREHFIFLRQGMQTPRGTLLRLTRAEVRLYCEKGELWLYDENMSGVIGGMFPGQFSVLSRLVCGVQTGYELMHMPAADRKQVLVRSRLTANIHAEGWYQKYEVPSYYIGQLAVAQEAKGTGVCRELLQFAAERAKTRGMNVALETFSQENVPIYKHLGFELVETGEDPRVPYAEYRMLYRQI